MPDDSKRNQENEPKTAREVAFDTMCSTIKQAYREWEKGEKKTACGNGLHVNFVTSKSTPETAPSR